MKSKVFRIPLLSSFLHVILLLFVLLVFGNKIVVNNVTASDKKDFYNKIETNYIIYGLNEEQQNEYNSFDDIDFIYSYYRYETNITIDDKSYMNYIGIYTNDNICNTPFDEFRLIEKSTNQNPVYVDYNFASKNNVSLNDTIQLKLGKSIVDATISGIYGTNYLDDIHVMILYKDFKSSVDSMFEKFETNFSYIHTTNSESFDKYLKSNYIPKAFMKTRDDFDSDFDYAIYLKNYNSKEYYNSENVKQIVSDGLKVISSNSKNYIIISILLLLIGIIIGDFIIAIIFKKKLKLVSFSSNNYKSYSKYHFYSMYASFVIGFICMYIISLTYSSSIVKISFANVILNILPIIATFIISILLGLGIKCYFTYITLSSDKKSKKMKA